MFRAFDGPPKIVRPPGRGAWVSVDDPRFPALVETFSDSPDRHGARAVITVEVDRISDSCGYGVPLMDYRGDRDLLIQAHVRRTADDLVQYRATRNTTSIDQLPAFS